MCVRGKSDQQELHQCITHPPLRKDEVDQTLEIVSNDYCLGVGKGTGEENGNSINGSSSEGVFIALSIVSITIILGAVAATTF